MKNSWQVKRSLVIGEKFIVPCLVIRDGEKIISFTPVINHPHNDVENFQPETHYHTDYRFVEIKENKNSGDGFEVTDKREGFKNIKGRVELHIDGELEYHVLSVISEDHEAIAQKFFIRNSRLKHKCIVKGKCPHRGYDLSQEKSVDGVITCPLHGLEFYSATGMITNKMLNQLKDYSNIDKQDFISLKRSLRKVLTLHYLDEVSKQTYDALFNSPCAWFYSMYQKKEGDWLVCRWTKIDKYHRFYELFNKFPKELNFKVYNG